MEKIVSSREYDYFERKRLILNLCEKYEFI